MSPRAGQNLSAGRMWPSGRSLETPGLWEAAVKSSQVHKIPPKKNHWDHNSDLQRTNNIYSPDKSSSKFKAIVASIR